MIPTVITANTKTGGHIKLHTLDPNKSGEGNIGGGARDLNQFEFNAYRQAKEALGRGNAQEAIDILEKAGFTV